MIVNKEFTSSEAAGRWRNAKRGRNLRYDLHRPRQAAAQSVSRGLRMAILRASHVPARRTTEAFCPIAFNKGSPSLPLLQKASDLRIRTAQASSGGRTFLRPRPIFVLSCDFRSAARPVVLSCRRKRMALSAGDSGSDAGSMDNPLADVMGHARRSPRSGRKGGRPFIECIQWRDFRCTMVLILTNRITAV